ncbi:unnamed protein product [Caenorhabditis brenneri]
MQVNSEDITVAWGEAPHPLDAQYGKWRMAVFQDVQESIDGTKLYFLYDPQDDEALHLCWSPRRKCTDTLALTSPQTLTVSEEYICSMREDQPEIVVMANPGLQVWRINCMAESAQPPVAQFTVPGADLTQFPYGLMNDGKLIFLSATPDGHFDNTRVHMLSLNNPHHIISQNCSRDPQRGMPIPRKQCGFDSVTNAILMAGGEVDCGNGFERLVDYWVLNTQTFQWLQVPSQMPCPLNEPCLTACHSGTIYVWGDFDQPLPGTQQHGTRLRNLRVSGLEKASHPPATEKGDLLCSKQYKEKGGRFDFLKFATLTAQQQLSPPLTSANVVVNQETEIRPNLEKKKKVDNFMGLPDAADSLIERAWNKTLAPNEKFVEAFSIDIYRKDLLTLTGLHWLNDNIVTIYLQLICDRSVQHPEYPKTYAFPTIFYTNIITKGYPSVRRYTRKIDLFSFEIILVPVHLGMHWCMAVIDMVERKIELYDSLYDGNTDVLPALKKYIAEESLDKKKVEFDFSGWKIYQMEDIPRQQNGSDCGVFSCQFGECASRRQAPCFTQTNMPYFRKRMAYEIVEQKLLAPPPLTPRRPTSHQDAKDVPSCSGESTPAGALSPRSDTREVTNAYDEMIATEISYVADLKEVIIHYLEPFEAVENQNSLPEALRGKPDCLFGNIRELYKFHHRVVLEDLVAARSTAEMCRVLMQHRNKICITYRTYGQIHGSNQKVRNSVRNHPFFKDCQRKANHNMDMSSYLLKPIQRIMKYQLFLGNIMDDCPTDVRDEVAMTHDSMVDLLTQIDASKQQLHISGYNGDLKSLGLLRLQTECDVYTYNRKKKAELSRAQKRFIFFFDGAVMFCKKRVSNPGTGLNSEPEYFEHKFCIPIISLGHEAASRTGAGRFEVWDEAKTAAYVIETIDPSARTKWIRRLGKSDMSQDTWLDQK